MTLKAREKAIHQFVMHKQLPRREIGQMRTHPESPHSIPDLIFFLGPPFHCGFPPLEKENIEMPLVFAQALCFCNLL